MRGPSITSAFTAEFSSTNIAAKKKKRNTQKSRDIISRSLIEYSEKVSFTDKPKKLSLREISTESEFKSKLKIDLFAQVYDCP